MLLLFPIDYDTDSFLPLLPSTLTSRVFNSTGLAAVSAHRHNAQWQPDVAE